MLRSGYSQVLGVWCLAFSFCSGETAYALPLPSSQPSEEPTVVVRWDNAALQSIRNSRLGPPIIARSLAIVHTCIYDAWAAYTANARGTEADFSLRQPHAQRTGANRREAVSYAAFYALSDLFPHERDSLLKPLMVDLGYDPDNRSTDTRTAAGVGNMACEAVLKFRSIDGSNADGSLSASGVPYSDYTGYEPVNAPSSLPIDLANIVDPNRWQPLIFRDASNMVVTQSFQAAQWTRVIPFALRSFDQFRELLGRIGPVKYPSQEFVDRARELIDISANLADRQKVIAEY